MAHAQALQRHGWYLSPDGISECQGDASSNNADSIMKIALNLDLREIGEKHLPDGAGKNKLDSVNGPFVLQIMKVRNVSAPKDNEESGGAPPLLRLTLTDGHVTCSALQMKSITDLSLQTPPGTKLKLLGRVSLSHNFLLLDQQNCKIIGGHVDKLYDPWSLKKQLAKHHRTVHREGGPPPFVPFGQRRKDNPPPSNKRDNFKSLDTKEAKKEETEFDQQRQATIAKLQETKAEVKPKVFGNAGVSKVQQDKNIAKIVDMGFSTEQAAVALRNSKGNVEQALDSLLNEDSGYHHRHGGGVGRGALPGREIRDRDAGREVKDKGRGRLERGRRGQPDDEADDGNTKPSGPATLFDFLTEKIPAQESKGSKPVNKSSVEEKKSPTNLPPRLMKQQTHNDYRPRGNQNSSQTYEPQSHERQHSKSAPNRSQKSQPQGLQQTPRSHDSKNSGRQNHRDGNQYREQDSRQQNYRERNQDRDSGRRPQNRNQDDIYRNGRNDVHQRNEGYVSAPPADINSQRVPSMQFTASKGRNSNNSKSQVQAEPKANIRAPWRIGDFCFAKYYSDNQFYPAFVTALDPAADVASVTYQDYGNTERVYVSDLRPPSKQCWDASGTSGHPGRLPQAYNYPPSFSSAFSFNQQ